MRSKEKQTPQYLKEINPKAETQFKNYLLSETE